MTTIDTAKPQDSQQITEIFHQYNEIKQEFTLPTKKDEEKYISDVINQKDAVLLKAQINEKIVGYLILYIQSYPKAFFC